MKNKDLGEKHKKLIRMKLYQMPTQLSVVSTLKRSC